MLIGERVSFVVDPSVDHPAQVLGEVPKEEWIHLADGPVEIDFDAG